MADRVRELFSDAGFDLLMVADRSPERRTAALADADYAVAVNAPLHGEDIPAKHRLRLVHKWGAGYDTVDVEALRQRTIPLLRTTGVNAVFVAELALTLMIGARRHLFTADRQVHAGEWNPKPHWIISSSLAGKHVGFVGFGAVAQALAAFLMPFGCTLSCTKRQPLDPAIAARFAITERPLPELLAEADVVTLHAPLSPATRHMIGPREIAQMKPGAVLVNTARGSLVDEASLIEALRAKRIAGAGLDVFATEPLPADHPLRTLDNVVLTPHLGGKVRENLDGVVRHIVNNLLAHAAGKPLPLSDVVLAEGLDPPPAAPQATPA
jgi:D-3-phosphoglycerate dehydrogenase